MAGTVEQEPGYATAKPCTVLHASWRPAAAVTTTCSAILILVCRVVITHSAHAVMLHGLTGACLTSPNPGRAEKEATDPAEYGNILRLLYVAVCAAPNRPGLCAMAHLLLLLLWNGGNSMLTEFSLFSSSRVATPQVTTKTNQKGGCCTPALLLRGQLVTSMSLVCSYPLACATPWQGAAPGLSHFRGCEDRSRAEPRRIVPTVTRSSQRARTLLSLSLCGKVFRYVIN
jgi:hypothetical protein